MISSNDLKPGLTILVDGEIYTVLEASQNKTARSAMVVKAKVRNIRTGSNVELSWGGGEKVEHPTRLRLNACMVRLPHLNWKKDETIYNLLLYWGDMDEWKTISKTFFYAL